jgi:hypothetical protein
MEYTLRIFKFDKRCKSGEMHFGDYDYEGKSQTWMQEEMSDLRRNLYPTAKFRMELHETYVTRKNLLSGKEYQERFDTPNYCSPSSESYWSM